MGPRTSPSGVGPGLMARARIFPVDDPSRFVEFSRVDNEDWNVRTNVTSQPVEKGVDIVNHIQPRPPEIVFRGVLSNYDDPEIVALANGLEEVIDTIQDRIALLIRFANEGERLTYDGHNRIETGLLLTRLRESKSKKVGDGLSFNIGLIRFRIAESVLKETSAPPDIRKIQAKGRTQTKKKEIPGEDEAAQEENKSLLIKFFS